MRRYHCYAPGYPLPGEMIEAEISFFARTAFAAKHGISTFAVISRREDMIDDKWRKLTGMAPAGWDVVEV